MNVLYPLSYLPLNGRESWTRTSDHALIRRSNPWPCCDKMMLMRRELARACPLRGGWESNPQQACACLFFKQVPLPFGYEGTLSLTAAE